MKAFIEKVFKMKKQKQKEILDEIIHTEVAVEAVIKEVKKETKKKEVTEVKEVKAVKEVFAKPGHYFPDCNCFKCIRWRNQNA